MSFSQENRFLQIITEPWKDTMLLKGFGGTESISRLFGYELDLVSSTPVTPEDFLGCNFTFSMTLRDDTRRFFNGIVATLRSTGELSDGTEQGRSYMGYSATLVPWFWLLTRSSNSKIFQGMTVPQILEQVLGEHEFSDFNNTLQGNYNPREYCVQYRETDFAFLSRLMEEEGIFYYFAHENNRNILTLGDTTSALEPCPNQAEATLHPLSDHLREEDVVFFVENSKTIRSGRYTVNDYNYELPYNDLKVEIPTLYVLGPGEKEIYDYPAEIKNRSEGVRLADLRMQAEEAQINRLSGNGNCRSFASGYHFRLTSERNDIREDEWVLTQVSHSASQPVLRSQAGETEASAYTNSFTCLPYGMPYRHPLTIPKPVIAGVQTAFVVGPQGEEIYTDELGRVKILFHWDRDGKASEDKENASCWVRVAQIWAGPGWGSLFIPRIGHEVVVDFIEGDPDRPIIVGSVYHNNNRPPYDLPVQKTKTTIKSDTSPGGGGFNEIRFEDEGGEEEIYIHAQKDRNDQTLNDQTLTVGNNRTASVEVNDEETIGGNQTVAVEGNQTITVRGNITIQSSTVTTLQLDNGVTIQTSGAVTVQSGAGIELTAPRITLNAPMVNASGILQCNTLMANSVISASYSPGAGNIW